MVFSLGLLMWFFEMVLFRPVEQSGALLIAEMKTGLPGLGGCDGPSVVTSGPWYNHARLPDFAIPTARLSNKEVN